MAKGVVSFLEISIHTPLAGSDRVHVMPQWGVRISIHTPLAGSDFDEAVTPSAIHDFNPHSPCGERPHMSFATFTVPVFQSTLPLRGAT